MPDLCGGTSVWSGFYSSWFPTLSHFAICALHEWFSRRILAWDARDYGSILWSCIIILAGCLRRAEFRSEERTLARRGRLTRYCKVRVGWRGCPEARLLDSSVYLGFFTRSSAFKVLEIISKSARRSYELWYEDRITIDDMINPASQGLLSISSLLSLCL